MGFKKAFKKSFTPLFLNARNAQDDDMKESQQKQLWTALQDEWKHKTNFIFSPYSYNQLMGMMTIASRKETQDSLLSYFQIDDKHEFKNNFPKTIVPNTNEGDTIIKNGRHIWIRSNFSCGITDKFKDDIKELYGLKNEEGTEIDDVVTTTVNNLKDEIPTINRWVKQITGGKIPELLENNSFGALDVMIFVHTVYVNLKWPGFVDGGQRNFTLTDGTVLEKNFIVKESQFEFQASLEFEIIVKIYCKNKRYALILALPNKYYSEEPIPIFSNDEWEQDDFKLYIPPFTVRSKVALEDTTKKLGIKIFEEDQPNFKPLGSKTSLFTSKIIQEVTMDVTKNGIEAEAEASAARVSWGMNTSKQIVFDRQFYFNLIDESTTESLFYGYIQHPMQPSHLF